MHKTGKHSASFYSRSLWRFLFVAFVAKMVLILVGGICFGNGAYFFKGLRCA